MYKEDCSKIALEFTQLVFFQLISLAIGTLIEESLDRGQFNLQINIILISDKSFEFHYYNCWIIFVTFAKFYSIL
jgi:hypothetical protein